jgi:excisionase family DNA binding protein
MLDQQPLPLQSVTENARTRGTVGTTPAFSRSYGDNLVMDVSALSFTQTDFQPQVGRSVSIEQAAQLLGVSRRTVYYRIRDGRLRTIRTIGGSQRVLMDSVEEMRAAH